LSGKKTYFTTFGLAVEKNPGGPAGKNPSDAHG